MSTSHILLDVILQQTREVGIIIVLILQMRKLNLREITMFEVISVTQRCNWEIPKHICLIPKLGCSHSHPLCHMEKIFKSVEDKVDVSF